jgi:hypothetical protein
MFSPLPPFMTLIIAKVVVCVITLNLKYITFMAVVKRGKDGGHD